MKYLTNPFNISVPGSASSSSPTPAQVTGLKAVSCPRAPPTDTVWSQGAGYGHRRETHGPLLQGGSDERRKLPALRGGKAEGGGRPSK